MLNSYLPILILLIVAALLPIGMMFVTSLFGPKLRTEAKGDAYECGVPAVGTPRQGMTVHFHKIAILFLLFDIEAALLIPWALVFKDKLSSWGPGFLILELIIFLVILFGGYIYAWHRGALEWE